MPDFDSLGDRMKSYEKHSTGSLLPFIPAFARLDGKNFHAFTRNLKRPYDERLVKCMTELTFYLVKETNARMGYTQSDEITLTWYTTKPKSQIFFNGKIQKMNSILASMATLKFRELLEEHLPEKAKEIALFDCRVWNVPNIVEGANVFVWREQDATRNSIQMSARSVYSHKQCENKSCPELQEMLFQKGINWNDYPDFFKKGTYVQNQIELEWNEREQKNQGNLWPVMNIRNKVNFVTFPIITKILNREDVIYKNKPVQEDYRK